MRLHLAVACFAVFMVGCATATVSPMQRSLQEQTLQENFEKLKSVKVGNTKAEVQGIMGIASNRHIFLDENQRTEEWFYSSKAGYTHLIFREERVSEIKESRTPLTFARDTTIPFTEEEMKVHLSLSLVTLGSTKEEVSALPLKPWKKFSEAETKEFIAAMREMLAAAKDAPFMSGLDFSSMLDREVGEMWMYGKGRLTGALFLKEGRVIRINFAETPTKAQQAEMMQRAF